MVKSHFAGLQACLYNRMQNGSLSELVTNRIEIGFPWTSKMGKRDLSSSVMHHNESFRTYFSNHLWTRWLFMRILGFCYVCAFASFWVQSPGLYGHHGILPVDAMKQNHATFTWSYYLQTANLIPLHQNLGITVDMMVDVVTLVGLMFSTMVMIGYDSIVFAAVPYLCYATILNIGQTFMSFQWDILLLEVGAISLVLVPWLHSTSSALYLSESRGRSPAPIIGIFLLRWLLFRLMFASGIVKLTSNCPTWWGLTALNYHYETQCIPSPLAWYAHHLPEWFQKLSVAATFIIEIFLAFFYILPIRSMRIFSGLASIFLMVLIILTGNYNFFNVLTIALSIATFDDEYIISWLPRNWTSGLDSLVDGVHLEKSRDAGWWRVISFAVGASAVVYLCSIYFQWVFIVKTSVFPYITVNVDLTVSPDAFAADLRSVYPITVYVGVSIFVCSAIIFLLRSLTYKPYRTMGFFGKSWNVLQALVILAAATILFIVSLESHNHNDPTSTSTKAVVPVWNEAVIDHMNAPYLAAEALYRKLRPFHVTNSYGLFRRMTGVGGRPEVIIEGSNTPKDPSSWTEFHFKYKPGDTKRELPIVAPHQPRLDWQMWFAALGTYNRNPWFGNMCGKLMKGEPKVYDLLDSAAHGPEGTSWTAEKPPRAVRAALYHYHFTTESERVNGSAATNNEAGHVWKRTHQKAYFPEVTITMPAFKDFLEQSGFDRTIKEKTSRTQSAITSQIEAGDHVATTIYRALNVARALDHFYFVIAFVVTVWLLLRIPTVTARRWA